MVRGRDLLGKGAILAGAGYALSCLMHRDYIGASEFIRATADYLQYFPSGFDDGYGVIDLCGHVAGTVGAGAVVLSPVVGLANKISGKSLENRTRSENDG